MANISLADQLDDAIEMMIAEPDSALPKVDLAIGELLGIAAELRFLPDPSFKAALKSELFVQSGLATLPTRGKRRELEAVAGPILPSLFGEGSGAYPVHRANFAISAAIHAALTAAVVTAGFWMAKHPPLEPHTSSVMMVDLITPSLPPAREKTGGGGGGGDHDKLQESRGSLPRFARDQIAPPAIVVRNQDPKLPAEPTIVGPPELNLPQTSPVGNPLSAIVQAPSNGIGGGGGIGSGEGGGVGVGTGPGFGPGYGGGVAGGAFRVGGGVSAPRAIYDPDPEYSEEARRAKYQGSVLLWLVVGVDGRPRDIRVQRTLGMGLDEKAIEAVRTWRFTPGMKDGRAVAVQVNVEVSFRLY
ncbi:MAG TPA: energy transducer TonB [Terriglobales bacterium]|nr:energy transducer TonB [Terriglobales bacterium]